MTNNSLQLLVTGCQEMEIEKWLKMFLNPTRCFTDNDLLTRTNNVTNKSSTNKRLHKVQVFRCNKKDHNSTTLANKKCSKLPFQTNVKLTRKVWKAVNWFSIQIIWLVFIWCQHSEAVARRCSVKKVFLEISQNSQENACARVSFLIKLQTWGPQPY